MKNPFLIVALLFGSLISSSSCGKKDSPAEPIAPLQPQNIYPSSLINPSLEELQAFFDASYDAIAGDLELTDIEGLTNLVALSKVISIEGSLIIQLNADLVSLDGIEKLQNIGKRLVIDNRSLANINGLSSLSSIGGDLILSSNDHLTNIDGFSKLTIIGGGLYIMQISSLREVDGLSSLDSIGGILEIISNDSITNLNGLSSLISVGWASGIAKNKRITKVDSLLKFASLNDFVEIIENKNLANIDGLSGRFYYGEMLIIASNPLLSDLCGIKNVISSNGVSGDIYIQHNAYKPTVEEIIAGNCSQ